MTEEIITDYRQTVQRLQEELKEKSDMIFKLMDYVERLEQENKDLKENQCHFSTCEHIDAEIARYAKLSESFLKYRSALEEILESAKFAQCLPCGSGNLEDCLNCDDEITNNGQFCMEKRIHEIKTKCVEVLTP